MCNQVASVPGAAGNLYMATMTGPEHFVEHAAEEAVDLLNVEGLGLCKVVLILRSAVFRDSMASIRANPNIVHTASQAVLQAWFLKNRSKFTLPGMQDLMTMMKEHFEVSAAD